MKKVMDTELWLGVAMLIAIFSLGCWFDGRGSKTPPTPRQVGTTTVVEVPKITERVVKEFIQDPTQAKLVTDLMAENKRLKLQVVSLTSSVSKNESSGGVGVNNGTITEVQPIGLSVQPTNNPRETLATVEREFEFRDFQLEAKYSAKPSFTYNLHQEFIITTTTGRDSKGHSSELVKLTQKVGNTVVEVPTTTINLQADPNPTRYMVGVRIQGGGHVSFTGEKSALVALQWLRRGTSNAAEDSSLAFLSPALSAGGLTLLPVSVNLGRIPKQPFTNIWISPTINLSKSVGVAVSATF